MNGLSPRVRGSRGKKEGDPAILRSIPACAGKPVNYAIADYVE